MYATDYAKQLSFRCSRIPSLIEEGGEKQTETRRGKSVPEPRARR